MKLVSFMILMLFVSSLFAASLDVCTDHSEMAAAFPLFNQAASHNSDNQPLLADACCAGHNDDADRHCGTCPCLCHTVAITPTTGVLTATPLVSLIVKTEKSLVSTSLFRIDRPPRIS